MAILEIPYFLPFITVILFLLLRLKKEGIFFRQLDSRLTFSYKLMPAVVTLLVLGASLYVIISGDYEEDYRNWAFGCVGTVLGYWLK